MITNRGSFFITNLGKAYYKLIQLLLLLNGTMLQISTQHYSDMLSKTLLCIILICSWQIDIQTRSSYSNLSWKIDVLRLQKQPQVLSCCQTAFQLNFISRLHLCRYSSIHQKLLNNDSKADVRYFTGSKFSRNLSHKKKFGLT